MDNLVYFNLQALHTPHPIDLLCIYLPDSAFSEKADFYSLLALALTKNKNLPDGIILYYSRPMSEEISTAWKDDTHKSILFDRFTKNNIRFTKSFYFVEISTNGFSLNVDISNPQDFFTPSYEQLKSFYIKGIKSLVEKNDVLHYAPAGHNFRHPSGNILKLFIQAKELACNEAEMQFVSRGIFLQYNDVDWSALGEVFIDSMGIYSFIREALTYANSNAKITNFHSYDGLKNLIPSDIPHLVFISASTSGNMAKKIIEAGFLAKNIITLLSVENNADLGSSLIHLDFINKEFIKDNKSLNHESEIELVGEQFTFRAKPPKEIVIGINHRPDTLIDILKVFGKGGVNKLNENISSIGKTPLISLKPAPLLRDADFNEWLKNELTWNLPATITTIIYKEDGASKQLAIKIRLLINNLRGDTGKIKVLEANTLSAKKMKGCTGVLVVSAFSGDGSDLRQISRDLREYEKDIIEYINV